MERITYENGVHIISNDDYHSSNGLSRSALWQLTKSPKHFFYHYLDVNKEPEDDGIALIRGEAVHTLVLEPMKFRERFIIQPEINKRTKLGKAEYEEFMLRNEGLNIITKEQYDEFYAIADSVLMHEWSSGLFSDAKIEQSIFFTHEKTGLQCKVKPDAWLGSVVTDLKTTSDASPRAFKSSAYKYGYFLQCGMIKCALESIGETLEEFVFFCVETSKPYPCALYRVPQEVFTYGVQIFDNLMLRMEQCLREQQFEDYGVQWLTLPSWANFDDFLE